MRVKEVLAGAKATFQLNYVPEYIIVYGHDSLVSLADKVSVKVTPLGDGVICDLDGAGATRISQVRQVGGFIAPDRKMSVIKIPLADGVIPGKVTDYEIDNTSSTDVSIYAPISKKGTMYIQSMQQTLLANSQFIFTDFSVLAFQKLEENSQLTVEYEDGASHTYSFLELAVSVIENRLDIKPILDNIAGRVRKATAIPATQQKAYLVRYRKLQNL